MILRLLLLCTVTIAITYGLPHAAVAQAAALDCLIQPYVIVTVSTSGEGVVETVSVDRGALVEKGQILVTLESSLEKAAVAIARFRAESDAAIKINQARVEFGTRRLARSKELYNQKTLSFQELDEVESQKLLAEMGLLEAQDNQRLARLELQRAMAALALRTIRSPIAGVVIQRLLSPGEFADQAPVLKLAQLDPLRVEVFAPLSLLGKITVGLRAQVVPEGPLKGPYAARVAVVDRVMDAASGTFGVRLELPNPGHRLPAGLKCKVRLPG